MPPEPNETKRVAPAVPNTDANASDADQATDPSDVSADEEQDVLGELDISSAEFHSLNESLDSLSSALDNIERKNDSLHAQLLLLLQSQRDTLKSFKEENGDKAEQAAAGSGDRPEVEVCEGGRKTDQQLGEPMEQS